MTQKTYRTAQGKIVDMGALQLKNENVRAVGNMSVNSRGDLIDGANRPIDTRNQQVARQYKKQISSNVSDSQVYSSSRNKIQADIPVPPEDFEDNFKKDKIEIPGEGLAAAIARAKQTK